MQGSNYRDAWSEKVKFPIVFLDTLYGGMEIIKEGGGKQTHSLKLRAKNDILYTLRSVTKDPGKLIPEIAEDLGLENIIVDDYEIKEGDWILAFNENILVGSRQWLGEYTDVPVMGYDGNNKTLGYCNTSDIPSFKIFNFRDGVIMNVESSFPAWSNLNTYLIDSLSNNSIPTEFNLSPAYPNPFNPITHIEYSIPYKSESRIT